MIKCNISHSQTSIMIRFWSFSVDDVRRQWGGKEGRGRRGKGGKGGIKGCHCLLSDRIIR